MKEPLILLTIDFEMNPLHFLNGVFKEFGDFHVKNPNKFTTHINGLLKKIEHILISNFNNVVYHRMGHITEWATFISIYIFHIQHTFYQPFIIESTNNEVHLLLAIETFQKNKKLNIQKIA